MGVSRMSGWGTQVALTHLGKHDPTLAPPAFCFYRTWLIDVASVLKSKQALDVSISVIEIFVKMR